MVSTMPKTAEELEVDRIFSDDDYRPAQQQDIDRLGHDLLGEFEQAVMERREIEERLIDDLRQYAGQYSHAMRAELDKDLNRSDAFFRMTRAKVKAVDAKMSDLILTGRRTWAIKPSPEPVVADSILGEIRTNMAAAHSTPEKSIDPSEIPDEVMKDAAKQYATGAAGRMERVIDDQFKAGKLRIALRRVLHSGNLYGLGILKGAMTHKSYRIEHVYDKAKKAWAKRTKTERIPLFAAVPIWRYYPDLSVTDQAHCRYEWEVHRLPRSEMVQMAKRQSFARGRDAIINHIKNNPDGLSREFTYEGDVRNIGDRDAVTLNSGKGLYDVFERWGWIDAESCAAAGITVPAERMHETFYANIWILPNGAVIKIRLFEPSGVQSPYRLYRFEDDETSLIPEGLAAILRDDQRRVNACYRSAEDNLAITSGPQIELNLDMLPTVDPSQAQSISPFAIWLRKGGDSKDPAVRSVRIDSHVAELISAAKSFEDNAHEASLIPKFAYGDNPTQGAAGTASGMSMLLSQVNISLKDLVISYEDGVLTPAVTAAYDWNMQHNEDDSIKGDFQVDAMGATNLIAQEVQVQQSLQFGASLQPEERRYVDFYKLVSKRADIQDLGDIVMPREEAEAAANSEAAQKMQAINDQMAEATLAKTQAQAANEAAKAAKTEAEVLLTQARTINEKMGALFAGMQSGGMAAASPATAAAADSLLRAGGWTDAPQEAPVAATVDGQQPVMPQQQGGPAPAQVAMPNAQPQDANTGQTAGIETVANEGVVNA